jgi:hypothetical protein
MQLLHLNSSPTEAVSGLGKKTMTTQPNNNATVMAKAMNGDVSDGNGEGDGNYDGDSNGNGKQLLWRWQPKEQRRQWWRRQRRQDWQQRW